jgi:hypothetical protein
VVLHMLAVGVTAVLPAPRLGTSQAVVDGLAFRGGGLWIEQPHRVLAAGRLSFLCRTPLDVYGGSRTGTPPASWRAGARTPEPTATRRRRRSGAPIVPFRRRRA